jgi:membrane protein implicated in regulation of membrane protease activity
MKYRYKRHITNTLLYAAIITALIAIIKQYTWWGGLIFAIVSVAALAADRYVENQHLKEEEQKETNTR